MYIYRTAYLNILYATPGPPKGTVLYPFLFTIYTSYFQYSSEWCHLQKFSDDITTVCVQNGKQDKYRLLVDRFVQWCGDNHFQMKVVKTEVVDFRSSKSNPNSNPVLSALIGLMWKLSRTTGSTPI